VRCNICKHHSYFHKGVADKYAWNAIAPVSTFPDRALEHTVRITAPLRHSLHDIPMLDDLAIIIEPENVDGGEILHTGPFLQAVQDYVVAFGKGAFYGDTLAGVLPRHALKEVDKAQFAGLDVGIVLNEFVADILFDGVAYLVLIENQIVEGDDVFFSFIGFRHLADHFFFLPVTAVKRGRRIFAL
jgi:hypothetical protein